MTILTDRMLSVGEITPRQRCYFLAQLNQVSKFVEILRWKCYIYATAAVSHTVGTFFSEKKS